jgi:hypothetical protein
MELDDLQNLLATPVPIIPRELCGSGHFGLSFESRWACTILCGCAVARPRTQCTDWSHPSRHADNLSGSLAGCGKSAKFGKEKLAA